MKTIKQYQKNVNQKTCEAVILDVIDSPESLKDMGINSKRKSLFAVIPDVSVFFPTGGGQPCDLGTMRVDNSVDYLVVDVFEKDGAVIHVIDAGEGSTDPQSLRGKRILLSIDWERRFDNMQRHCGEHILSGVFDRLFGGVNRGFHMGGDFMTIDINPEKNPAFDQITWDMARQAELAANQVIWSDAPVTVRHFETREEAESLPLRKPLAIDEDISIVCVGDPRNPSDCVACCGTHPTTAGQVGLIKIFKLENYKGMTRVYLEAGSRALEDYRKKHEIVSRLSNQYSTETDQLVDSVEKQNRRSQDARQELAELKRALMEDAQTEIEEFYRNGWNPKDSDLSGLSLSDRLFSGELSPLNGAGSPTPIACKSFAHLRTDDVQTLGRRASPSVKGLLLLISRREFTAVLLSPGKPDCGKLVRENVSICQGKGGGNAACARAIFTSEESLANYVDLLEKHLR